MSKKLQFLPIKSTFAFLLCLVAHVATASLNTPVPQLNALKITENDPQVDGVLDESVWQDAVPATGFVQLHPYEGQPATEKTEARVLYGPDALFVGIRAYDTNPEMIQGQLTRRDQGSFSDWVYVAVDSYDDNRTAFQFGVNPAGVKRDSYRFNDTRRDSDWDAVWDVETTEDELGWTAEFRIPYSQLRYTAAPQQTWGIQFMRSIARKDESTYWAPLSGDDNAMVSRFGRLQGLQGIEPHTRLEVKPYALSRLHKAPMEEDNPFFEENDTFNDAGLDVKYGLTSNLTLDLTVNPDFGQVEADPAQVNLSAFETFFPERRPFFLEGANIFDFGIGNGDRVFHSRRIGRKPQGWADPQGGYVDAPENTTIQAAGKLSGKTADGWSIGLLYAATAEESARVITGEGDRLRELVEPATDYAVVRIEKDLRDGLSTLGMVATAVSRDDRAASNLDLHDQAYTGGIDFRHRFGDENYEVTGYVLGSHVAGSETAIAHTQLAPARYMHRPDADHVTFDPTRTDLDGLGAEVNFSKVSGGFWRYSLRYRTRTPEFETNDIGFMQETDFHSVSASIGYEHYLPTRSLRRWNVKWNNSQSQSYGGERTNLSTRLGASVQFLNYWNAWAGVSYNEGSLSLNALRGGPAIRTDDRLNLFSGFSSDGRKDVQLNFNANVGRSDGDSWWFGLSPNLNWRPSGRLRFSLGAFYNHSEGDSQWVTRISKDQDHYIFGHLAQETAGVTMRLDYAFTRDLSLELYARPFVSAGRYDEFKQVADPLAKSYGNRYADLVTEQVEGGSLSDVDGDGTAEFIHDPNFNFKQFRSNAVLRWEYRPGSTVFLVWSHGRQHSDQTGDFSFGDNVSTVFDEPGDDIVMLKLNYWLNPSDKFGA